MHYDAAIGFSSKSKELRDQVDAALPALGDKIVALRTKYAMPDGRAVTLAAAEKTPESPAPTANPDTPAGVQPVAPATGPTESNARNRQPLEQKAPKSRKGGRSSTAPAPIATAPTQCSRNGGSTCVCCIIVTVTTCTDVFLTTVTKGRPAKGMPTWEGVFTEQDFAKIYAFLITVQDPEH